MNRREALKTTFFTALLVAIGELPSLITHGNSVYVFSIRMDTNMLRYGDIISFIGGSHFSIEKHGDCWYANEMKQGGMKIKIEHSTYEESDIYIPFQGSEPKGKNYALIASSFSENSTNKRL